MFEEDDGEDDSFLDFDLDPMMMLGSTLGNAIHSGLDIEDVMQAYEVASEPEFMDVYDPMVSFDTAIDIAAKLKRVVKDHHVTKIPVSESE